MRLTKFEHSTLVLEKDGRRLIIDPGSFTAPFDPIDHVDAVVLTHEHPDHWTAEHLDRVLAASPDAQIFAPAALAAQAAPHRIDVVAPGDHRQAGPFALSFHGGRHAVIHPSIPVIDNVGVFVDERLYYGGDSFDAPDSPVEILAVPAGAPWLKVAEVMDYVAAVAPAQCFTVHEQVLSAPGLAMSRQRIADVLPAGSVQHALNTGDSLELG